MIVRVLARRRAARIAAGLFVAALLSPAAASAHPLGNFSVNHLTEVRVSAQRTDILYVLDQAEIPTFQERGLSAAQVIARKEAEVAKHLKVTVDGRPLALTPGAPKLSHPPGQGGLPLTRLELPLRGPGVRSGDVRVDDGTFPDRIGWKAVLPLRSSGTDIRSSVPATDPTGGLRSYPKDLLKSPADIRSARLRVTPGTGTLTAPGAAPVAVGGRGSGGFASVLQDGGGVIVLLLAAAFGWGALHALSPGHGKSMVAAYLVGTRGSVRDAVVLGGTVTVAHTAGVIALGVIALALSQFILPEQLYPWLNLVAGLMVVTVGIQVLRRRLKRAHHHHHHDHHHHHHEHRGSILALGASAGLIPCPSALVVLLGAVSQHRLALGLVLILAFSAGLATTLTSLGIAVVKASQLLGRLRVPGRLSGTAPAISAALIVVIGAVLTAKAVPTL